MSLISCLLCLKRYVWRCESTSHTRTGTNLLSPFLCETCLKKITRNSDGSIGKIRKGEKSISSQIRSKKFTTNDALTSHKRVHPGKKRFWCEACLRNISSNYEFSMHTRLYMGEKPFRCKYCPEKFSQKCSLNRHMHHVHSYRDKKRARVGFD